MAIHPTITEFKRADWKQSTFGGGYKLAIPCSVSANPSVWKYDTHGDLHNANVDMKLVEEPTGVGLWTLWLIVSKPFTGEVRGL